jgi:hypothetical protein
MFLAFFGAAVALAFEPEIKIIKMIIVYTVEKFIEKVFSKKQQHQVIDI